MTRTSPAPSASPAVRGQPRALRGLLPFLRPYRWPIAAALLCLLLASAATLAFPLALRQLIDQALAGAAGAAGGAAHAHDLGRLRAYFALLFAVAAAVGVFSAARYYAMSWLGERVTADLRSRVYAQVLRQSPAFFETTQTGEVLSRLTADVTLVQTVIGSSFSMGLRNAVLGLGALAMLVWSSPLLMGLALSAVLVVVLPAMLIGRRVRRLSRASQDRVADASAIAAEVLGAIPAVQGFTAEGREAARFAAAAEDAFRTAVRRSGVRAALIAFIIVANAALLLWGLYRGAEAVLAGQMSAGALGQTIVYALFLAGAVAVLGEVYGDLLRAAGAMERLMELLAAQPDIASPILLNGSTCRPGGPGRWRSRRWISTTRRARIGRRWRASRCTAGPARQWPWSVPAGPARPRCSSCCSAFMTCRPGASRWAAATSARWGWMNCARISPWCRRTR